MPDYRDQAMRGTTEERFWAKVNKDGPVHPTCGQCWMWTGAKFGNGRGHFSTWGRFQIAAHIYVLEVKLGRKLLTGMNALHRCDTPLCVNPDHLWEGTQQDNIKDMMAKGRGKNQLTSEGTSGVKNIKAKVTEDMVRWIRKMSSSGMRQKDIGHAVGLTQAVVSKIVRRTAWKHVKEDVDMPKIIDKTEQVQLAVSLEDLDRVPTETKAGMLSGRIDLEDVMKHAGQHRAEEVPAVRFTCSLLVAASIIDLLRSWDRQVGAEPTRAFIRKGTTWTRVPVGRPLTVKAGDGIRLNPDLFGAAAKEPSGPQTIEMKPAKPVKIGGRP